MPSVSEKDRRRLQALGASKQKKRAHACPSHLGRSSPEQLPLHTVFEENKPSYPGSVRHCRPLSACFSVRPTSSWTATMKFKPRGLLCKPRMPSCLGSIRPARPKGQACQVHVQSFGVSTEKACSTRPRASRCLSSRSFGLVLAQCHTDRSNISAKRIRITACI